MFLRCDRWLLSLIHYTNIASCVARFAGNKRPGPRKQVTEIALNTHDNTHAKIAYCHRQIIRYGNRQRDAKDHWEEFSQTLTLCVYGVYDTLAAQLPSSARREDFNTTTQVTVKKPDNYVSGQSLRMEEDSSV